MKHLIKKKTRNYFAPFLCLNIFGLLVEQNETLEWNDITYFSLSSTLYKHLEQDYWGNNQQEIKKKNHELQL